MSIESLAARSLLTELKHRPSLKLETDNAINAFHFSLLFARWQDLSNTDLAISTADNNIRRITSLQAGMQLSSSGTWNSRRLLV